MHVLALEIELHIPSAQSLKQRRAALRPITEGIRQRFSLSVAETDHQDLWQRAQVGVAIVSGTPGIAESVADDVERFVWSFTEIEVAGIERHWMEIDR